MLIFIWSSNLSSLISIIHLLAVKDDRISIHGLSFLSKLLYCFWIIKTYNILFFTHKQRICFSCPCSKINDIAFHWQQFFWLSFGQLNLSFSTLVVLSFFFFFQKELQVINIFSFYFFNWNYNLAVYNILGSHFLSLCALYCSSVSQNLILLWRSLRPD